MSDGAQLVLFFLLTLQVFLTIGVTAELQRIRKHLGIPNAPERK